MKITIVGTGYVGLITGTCFANAGNNVTCLDIDPKKVETLRKGEAPFFEPGLSEMMTKSINAGRLHFTDDPNTAYCDSSIIFICVGTPTGEDGRCNLSHVMGVADSISDSLDSFDEPPTVVVKSTVPVGTTHKVAERLKGKYSIANCPEFLREGNAIDDFMNPDRVVCGVEDDRAQKLLEKVYAPFISDGHPIFFFDIHSSEMVKYASNAMLACKISFINEIASLCERNGANIERVRTGMCSDSRIGNQFFKPGIGYGGSCFPKDTLAVMEMGDDANAPCLVNTAVHNLNQRQRRWFADRILKHFNNDLTGKKVTLWGLAFKPNTDDVRDAPSIDIAKTLIEAGAEVTGFDPEAWETFRHEVPEVEIFKDMYDAANQADALVICTEWSEFSSPDFARLKTILNDPVVFDGRNLYKRNEMASYGFNYYSVGRPTVELAVAR
ncbi:MAG: UDP-glucose/GDP-mannose dehydrogenase family protein [Phycisphaerales bacterium]|nr:UDP-glucose/GDP-mannose dehydrogenase family protein [Phycisphaerales bacterium]